MQYGFHKMFIAQVIVLRRKLDAKQYATPEELRADVILVCENCYKYNPTSDPIHQHGRALQVISL